MDALELAPAVVVRVAAWPLGAITCLGRARPDPGADAHAHALAAERRLLWARTVQDPRFMRALALANPELARGLIGRAFPEVRNKSVRHLETTLYRYLARATSRTQPGDLWASVAVAGWGPRRRSEPRADSRCLVAPDLAPFRDLLLALAGRAPYPERALYKPNPTLARQPDGSYLLWSAPGREPSRQRRLAPAASVDAVFELLASAATWTRPAAADAIAGRLGVSAQTARQTVDVMCERGVLVGGLLFPRRFRDPWEALEQVERQLEPEHAGPWRVARERLSALAADLAAQIHRCDAATVLAAMDAAGAELQALAAALAVDRFAAPRAPLRCDLEAPWHLELGPDDARALARTIDEYTRYQAAEGLHGPLLRRAQEHALAGGDARALGAFAPMPTRSATDGPLTWDALLADHDPESELRRRCERLQARLERPGADVSLAPADPAGGPLLAALHASITTRELGSGLAAHGLSLDATAAYARFASLLASTPAQRLERWFCAGHRRLGERTGADPVALVYDHPTPNVLAQPRLFDAVLDPWGVTADQRPDRGLRLAWERERLVVWADASPRPAVVYAPTAANPRLDDPCLHALLLSSLHVPPLTGPGAPIVHAGELADSRHRPRLRLADGAVIHPRRTLVAAADLAALLRVKGAARFAAWQQLAARHGWPALLLLAGDDRAPLLVPRDSPLAVEAAFEGAAGLRVLAVEEFTRAAWVGAGDDDDHAHVADFVVPFARELGRPAHREPARAQELAAGVRPAASDRPDAARVPGAGAAP